MDLSIQSVEATQRRPELRRLPVRYPALLRRLEDRQFLEMDAAFRSSGGLLCGDSLATLMRGRLEQPVSVIARWIVERRAVSFEWQARTMLPVFQFDFTNSTLRDSIVEVVKELRDVFDDWDLALWFAQSNACLGGAAPVDVIHADPKAVLATARVDRFIARG